MVRRDRREVRDQLPNRVQHRLDVEMTKRQRALHDEALSAATRFHANSAAATAHSDPRETA